MAGVNSCRHCRGKGTCYGVTVSTGLFRKIRFSCDSCVREEGFENSFEVRKVVNCNVCKGSGLLPGANTFFQEYIKPKSFPKQHESQKSLENAEEPKSLKDPNTKLLGK